MRCSLLNKSETRAPAGMAATLFVGFATSALPSGDLPRRLQRFWQSGHRAPVFLGELRCSKAAISTNPCSCFTQADRPGSHCFLRCHKSVTGLLPAPVESRPELRVRRSDLLFVAVVCRLCRARDTKSGWAIFCSCLLSGCKPSVIIFSSISQCGTSFVPPR